MIVVPEEWAKRWEGEDIFDRLFALEGKVYRNKEGRKTIRFTIDGKNYFGKFHSGIGWNDLFKNLFQFRLPVIGAQNEWTAIKKLEHNAPCRIREKRDKSRKNSVVCNYGRIDKHRKLGGFLPQLAKTAAFLRP